MNLTVTNPDLTRLAEALNVTLQRHDGGKKGYWHPPSRSITTRRGLSIAEYKSTLAHEIAHAFHGDTPTGDIYSTRQELRADKWAANLLINPDEAKTVLYCYPHIEPAAYELEVTKHLLRVWVANNQHLLDNVARADWG